MNTSTPAVADDTTARPGPPSLPRPATDPPVTASGATALAVMVRLKLALLRNGLRQSAGRRAAYIASLVITVLFALLQLLGLLALRGHDHIGALVVMLATIVAVGWAVMPLFYASGDETLDPSRLVMFPLRPKAMVSALLVASVLGIGPLFTLLLAVGSVGALAHGGPAIVVAVLAVPLALALCLALARAVAAANVRLLTSRKGRDLAVLSGLVLAVGLQVVNLGMQKLSGEDGLSVLEPAARVMRWIPPATALDAVRTTGDGSYGVAGAQLALTVLALLGLLWWWYRTLTHLMTSPDASTQPGEPSTAGTAKASGWERFLPAGRTGTVMRRTLQYAWRDPKSKASWFTSLGVGLLLPVVYVVQGNGSVYGACWAAGLLGMQMYNQFGQDTSAFWMVAQTISRTRDAYLELRGRMYALLLVSVPYVVLTVLLSAALADDWRRAPEGLGLALCLLGAMCATGAMSSVHYPYSIPQENGMKNVVPGQAGLAWTSILGGLVAGTVLCAPVLALIVSLHLTGAHGLLWIVFPIGVVYGFGLAEGGLRLMAPRVTARLPEILAAVSKG